MKMLGESYTFLFMTAITLHLGTMVTSETCIQVPGFGRVCAPDTTPEYITAATSEEPSPSPSLSTTAKYLSVQNNANVVCPAERKPNDGYDPLSPPEMPCCPLGYPSFTYGPCPSTTRTDKFGKCRQDLGWGPLTLAPKIVEEYKPKPE